MMTDVHTEVEWKIVAARDYLAKWKTSFEQNPVAALSGSFNAFRHAALLQEFSGFQRALRSEQAREEGLIAFLPGYIQDLTNALIEDIGAHQTSTDPAYNVGGVTWAIARKEVISMAKRYIA